jgi:hypothetical protein
MSVGKQRRLTEILQNEYKTKGVLSGAAAATGKRLREIVDIRNLLFSGGGIGSVIGKKIFGKGYTATPSSDVSNIASKISTPSTGTFSKESVDILVSIKSDTRISAKNSSVLPGMARDMNLIRQNISKLLKIQGGSPSYKADMFFKKSSEREKEYESRFNKSTFSSLKEESKKEPSFFEVVFSVLTRLFASPAFLKFATILGGLVTAGVLLYQNFDKIKEKVIALKNAISNAADHINKLFFRDGQIDPKIAGAETQDVPMNVEPGFSDSSYPIPTDSTGDFFNDQALKRVKENTSASGSSTATAETKKFTRQDKQKLSPTQITGLGLLNRIMDREGIRDEELRKRIINLAMVESSLKSDIKGPIIRDEKSMHFGDQAHGLLQIMPKTAEEMGYSREDLKNPEKAAEAGIRYFMKNLKRFSGNLDAATVAHHAGPKTAKEFLETGKVGTKDVATGLSTTDYLSKISSLDSPKSTIGQSLSSVSTELTNAERRMGMSGSGGVVVQDNSVKTVTQTPLTGQQTASTYNPEWERLMELIVNPI